VTITLSYGYNT